MAERLVQCVKLKRELPGLDHPPFSGELGERIYGNVSQEAWIAYREHLKMVINEYRLTLGTQEANEMIEKHTEDYFFGPGASLPPGYIPPKTL
jgi:Fe-S cluster biosynthesis and repair protein YggX